MSASKPAPSGGADVLGRRAGSEAPSKKPGAALAIRNLRASIGGFRLDVPTLDVAPGEVFILLGASGAGKTVFLETLAGFHPSDGGSAKLFGNELLGTPPERRRIGVIFQDYSLFPHLTVRANILFGARHAGLPTAEADARLAKLTEMLEIGDMVDRSADAMSGGQKQRVGLARALMLQPDLLLFDEPLAALDAGLRDRLRDELRALLVRLRQTTVYVTHDRGEAFALGDQVGVLDGGKLLQTGTPADIFHRPADRRIAEFLGVDNLLQGAVVAGGADCSRVRIGSAAMESTSPGRTDANVTVCLHSDAVFVSRAGRPDGHANRLPGRVTRLAALGSLTKVHLDCGFPLVCTLTRGTAEDLGLTVGADVIADFRPEAVHLIG